MEPIRQAVAVPVREQTHVAEVRRAAHAMADRLGFSDLATARAQLVVSELAGNILHHATAGTIYLSSTPTGDALQIIAADRGPGIANLTQATIDGFTTSTTPGLGLGSVDRLSGQMDAFSQPGAGTVVSAILCGTRAPAHPHIAVLSTCIAGEVLNGDTWAVLSLGPAEQPQARELFCVIDGLGHGLHASEAADMGREVVVNSLAAQPDLPLAELVQRMHTRLRATRGAAVALISVQAAAAGLELLCCGVGNISATLHLPDGTDKSLVSSNGTVGHQLRRVQEFRYPVRPGSLLSMHSDGVATRWRMGSYPGLAYRAPATIAGVLYRDAVRGTDDATLLIARLGAAGADSGDEPHASPNWGPDAEQAHHG